MSDRTLSGDDLGSTSSWRGPVGLAVLQRVSRQENGKQAGFITCLSCAEHYAQSMSFNSHSDPPGQDADLSFTNNAKKPQRRPLGCPR